MPVAMMSLVEIMSNPQTARNIKSVTLSGVPVTSFSISLGLGGSHSSVKLGTGQDWLIYDEKEQIFKVEFRGSGGVT